jgi:26S proteasome regulatory subunit N6
MKSRTFLRQRIEARLATLLMESKEYSQALTFLNGLIKEVRRLDDKLHFSLRNLTKAKVALTAARIAVNVIYVPPAQQGAINLHSGILHMKRRITKLHIVISLKLLSLSMLLKIQKLSLA